MVVWRLPRGESLVSPGSHCPSCGHPIPWYRNIPVVTWIVQRGRCAWCGCRIPVFYVLVEALCAWLAFLSVCLWGRGWPVGEAGGWGSFALLSVPIALIDWEHFEIPDSLVVAAAVSAAAWRCWGADDALFEAGSILRDALLAGGLLYAIHFSARVGLGVWGGLVRGLLRKGMRPGWRRGWRRESLFALLRWARFDGDMEALGLGDVSLGLAAGASLGFPAVLLGLAPAALLGMFGHFLRRSNPLSASRAAELGLDPLAIPFGPFLALGFLLARLWIGFEGNPFPFQ